jgi:hypothetical protein
MNNNLDRSSPVVTCEYYNNESKIIYHASHREEELGDTSNMRIREIFAAEVTKYISNFYNQNYSEGQKMKSIKTESMDDANLWSTDSGLKRASQLMAKIALSADRHREIIKSQNIKENSTHTPIKPISTKL